MKKRIKNAAILSVLALLTSCGEKPSDVCTPVSDDDKVHLILLAGQSGARGKALVSDLSPQDSREIDDIPILADGYRMEQLDNISETISDSLHFVNSGPGFGDSSNEFGPEIGLAQILKERYPKSSNGGDTKAAIVKYSACGSTFYDDWMSESTVSDSSLTINREKLVVNKVTNKETGPLTNNFYQMIDKAKDYYYGLGYDTVVDGVIFVHGEQDAKYDANMAIYEKALTNFISDVRSYVGDSELPFIITEALTNSAKYSNELKEIQQRVCETVPNTYLVETSDLQTNTFEPWHFGASSNIELGKRVGSTLVALKDNRVFLELNESTIDVYKDDKNSLPKYLEASFDDGSSAYVPVTFKNYDLSKTGNQIAKVEINYNCHYYESDITLNVIDAPYVDGDVTIGYSGAKSNNIGDKVDLKILNKADGLYISAKVNDDDIWTDGENWSVGDMGQMDRNDDLEIYLEGSGATTGEATSRYSIFLSSANLLRVYDKGVNTTEDVSSLSASNLIFNKEADGFLHHVRTFGEVNGGTNTGMEMELFIPYSALDIDKENIKLMFQYRDVSSNDKTTENKETTHLYLSKGVDEVAQETKLENYFTLEELL